MPKRRLSAKSTKQLPQWMALSVEIRTERRMSALQDKIKRGQAIPLYKKKRLLRQLGRVVPKKDRRNRNLFMTQEVSRARTSKIRKKN
ncbi:MAG: hypothetical protein NTY48_02250 [Candidatus Diapherotrites archaeon]|nr:hypothetical protein [Candidatus Diapherotrites archaeon]